MKHQLDFEKPIVELQQKLEELRKHPETHSIDISFEEEVALIAKRGRLPGEERRPEPQERGQEGSPTEGSRKHRTARGHGAILIADCSSLSS